MSFHTGSKVSYLGGGSLPGVDIGDEGEVLFQTQSAFGDTTYHVSWKTGRKRNRIDLVEEYFLVNTGSSISVEEPEYGLTAVAARQSYDDGGAPMLFQAMVEEGQWSYAELADQALTLIAEKLWQDPGLQTVIAVLEESEQQELLHLASRSVLHEALRLDSGA